MIAHIAGVPVEEVLTPLVSAGGAGMLLARAWLGRHSIRRRDRHGGRGPEQRREQEDHGRVVVLARLGRERDFLRRSGGGRIRTSEGRANGFTARPLWPLGNTPGDGNCSQAQAQSLLAGVVPCQVTYPSAVTRATVVLKHPLPFLRGTRNTALPFTPVAIRPPK